MRILLIRHAEVPGNKERRYIGRTDVPLSEEGRRQARSVALPVVNRVYASPYLRCLQTAELMFPKQELNISSELRECDFGQFEGKTAEELSANLEYRKWVEGGCTGLIPGGERVSTFRQRCSTAFEKIVRFEAEKSDTLAFVVHGGVIMAVMECFDARKLDFYAYHVANCAYISCDCKVDDNIILTESGVVRC